MVLNQVGHDLEISPAPYKSGLLPTCICIKTVEPSFLIFGGRQVTAASQKKNINIYWVFIMLKLDPSHLYYYTYKQFNLLKSDGGTETEGTCY